MATVYFTRQLVVNDNNREKRANADRLEAAYTADVARVMRFLKKPASEGHGDLINAVKSILNRFPDKNKIVFDAYREMCLDDPDRDNLMHTFAEFKKRLAAEGIVEASDDQRWK